MDETLDNVTILRDGGAPGDLAAVLAAKLGNGNGTAHLNGNGVATVWGDHAEYLAQWAERRLVNRGDRWGAIGNMAGKPGWYKATGQLTTKKLARHFKGADATDVVGVYSTAPDPGGACWSLWVGADLDHHGEGPAPETTWKAAIACYGILTGLGFRPILEDSNGRGGYHVWVLFSDRVQTAIVRAFGLWLVRDWKSWGLDAIPEIFPKQDWITPKDCGNLLRLPGRHFKHPDHFSRIWSGDHWLEGEEAVDFLINTIGDDPGLIPPEVKTFKPKREKSRAQAKPDAPGSLEQLKHDLTAIDPKLGEESVAWKVKQVSEGQDILIGRCPFDHDSGTSNDGDLSAGFHEDGPYLKCLHESCDRSKEIHGQLGRLHSGASPNGANEAADDPHRLARIFSEKHKHNGELTLRFYRGESLKWTEGAFRPITESELKAGITRSTKAEFDRLNGIAIKLWRDAGGKDENGNDVNAPEARKVTRNLVADVTQALQSITILRGTVEAPSWIDGPGPFIPMMTLPARNALVSLPDVVSLLPTVRITGGTIDPSKAIVAPTPRFFSTHAIDFDFDLDAAVPIEWLRFLDSILGPDTESINALQEWFGYAQSSDTRQQKMLGLFGPKRAGKDTIARILTALVGAENTAGPTLASLSGDFGLAPLIGKPLAVISDARISKKSDAATIVERLLTITGEGRVTINRKFIEAWTGKLPTRFMLISNELPQLADSSGALAGRMILLRLTKSFYGAEDLTLFDRLIPELPGILLWALEGWRRLQKNGRFSQPKSGLDLLESLEELSSPMTAFIRECCNIGPGIEVETKVLYEKWVEWCASIGQKRPNTAHWFAKDLRAACTSVSTYRTDRGGKDMRFYRGIELKQAF
jgi:P4 family phage/plasmid primase-like protien